MVMSKVTEDGHDYVALSWVKAEIVSNLDQAQQILNKLVDGSGSADEKLVHRDLIACHDLLHQVCGALEMVGFPGAALFAEEMKLLCSELLKDNVEDYGNSLQILIQAVLQMPSYLDIIQTEGQDIPIALLPLINQMRECYKAGTLSEIELFSPKYYGPSASLTDEELKEIKTEGLTSLLRKLRQSLQLSLIDLIQNRNIEVAIDHLIKIFNYLGRLCKTTVISKLWQTAQAFVIAINEKSIPNSIDTKLLLKQIDLQIKLLTEKGVAGMNDPAPENLLKDLLFLLSTVESDSIEIQRIKREFQLTASTLGIKKMSQGSALAEMEPSNFESVSQALKLNFNFVKNKLNRFVHTDDLSVSSLDDIPERLRKISNTLEVLGLADEKAIIVQQQNDLCSASLTKEQASSALDTLANTELDIIKAVNKLAHADHLQDHNTAIKEVAYELVKVKDILSLYFDTNGTEGAIADVPDLLARAVHGLAVLNQNCAAAVVIRCLEYIDQHFIKDFIYPDNKEVESIVGAIASIDYYIDCLVKNQIVCAGNVLDFAIDYLCDLGCPVPENCFILVKDFISANSLGETDSLISSNEEPDDSLPESCEESNASEVNVSQEEYAPVEVVEEEPIDSELVEIFSEEMEEIFETLSVQLPAWSNNTDDVDSLKEVRRAFHTVKGSGRMVKAHFIGELGWSIENMLNRVLDNTILPSTVLLELVQAVVNTLPELVKEYAEGRQHERADVNRYMTVADALAAGREVPAELEEPSENVEGTAAAETLLAVDQDQSSSADEQLIVDHVDVAQDIDVALHKESPSEQEEFDTELVDIFVVEARIHIQVLKAFIHQCEQSLPQYVTDSLQRSMHTLKGSSLMANLGLIADIAKPFEGFLKECSINNWPIDKIDFELLKDAYVLLNEGINQLELHSLAPIEGSENLLERIRLRRDDLLSQLELNVSSDSAVKSGGLSPAKLAVNLLKQVDLLLDSEEYIQAWRVDITQEFTELRGLQYELNNILPIAIKAGFKPIADLSGVLLKAYQLVETKSVDFNDEFFASLIKAHQVLLDCIDQLAAGQTISDHSDEILALEKILAIPVKPVEKPAVELNSLTHDDLASEDKLVLGAPAPKGPIISSDHIDPDMAEIFLEEADDILEEARKDLDGWIKDQNADSLRDLQRQLHTLKGGARMCGAKGLGDVAHGLEFIYEGLLNGRYSYSAELVELLNKAHDSLQVDIDTLHDSNILPNSPMLLNAIQLFRKEGKVVLDGILDPIANETLNTPAEDIADVEYDTRSEAVLADVNTLDPVQEVQSVDTTVTDLDSVLHEQSSDIETVESIDEPAVVEDKIQTLEPEEELEQVDVESVPEDIPTELVESPAKPISNVTFRALEVAKSPAPAPVREISKEVTEQVKVSAELLDNLVNLAGETSIYRGRIEQQNTDLSNVLSEVEATVDRVRDQLRRLDIETQSQIISRHQTEVEISYTDFDPLEMDQYSQLQQLSKSLFESASDLLDLKDTLKRRNHDIATLLQQQGRINTELQEGLMRMRMVPLDRIAPRLRRLVRQVSSELGKDVDLVIGNTAGEMDRGVIDAIIAPLEHMIRNSLDHGIEKKEVRLAAGKPEKGTISLDLIREGGEMVLRLKDDGAGIPIDVVREKAINKGLIEPNDQLSNKEILQFILEAGFSTAKKITQISGRGVGLDVVVNAVKQLGGVLTLDSAEGKGTIFSIRLPINLSVSRALMVRVGEESYAIPMSTVEGVTYISSEQQKEFYQFGTAELEYGNESYRVKYLGELLGNQSSMQSPHIVEERAPVLLVRSGEYYMALRVDELLPSSEVVVKSLGVQFLSVPAISGATILGDGNVIIILDLSALVRSYFTKQHNVQDLEERRAAHESGVLEPEIISRPPLVMVVDDSVTVRKVTTRLLERQGMEVITARDGLDAVTQLDERIPDIMLLDIEMPRMDGFEVATRVRYDARTKHLPIIMITSRSGDKHRERALGIGVNEYMSKPFMDAKLIKTISDLLPSFEVNLLESSS